MSQTKQSSSWRRIAEALVHKGVITEARDIEYYVEDKLLSAVLPTTRETSEITFFVAGGEDEARDSSAELKQKGVRLLVQILKLLNIKGYFGDVGQFLASSEVKRQLSSYGILHAPLAQPLSHKAFRSMLVNAGLNVVSAQQYEKVQERELDKQTNPDELKKYKEDEKRRDAEEKKAGRQPIKPPKEDEPEEGDVEESMNVVERALYRKYQQQNIIQERPRQRSRRHLAAGSKEGVDVLWRALKVLFNNVEELDQQSLHSFSYDLMKAIENRNLSELDFMIGELLGEEEIDQEDDEGPSGQQGGGDWDEPRDDLRNRLLDR